MKTIEQMYNEAKALVEDRTYNIGEISEKTGLQKTANGWVKPKKGTTTKKEESNKKTAEIKYTGEWKTDAEKFDLEVQEGIKELAAKFGKSEEEIYQAMKGLVPGMPKENKSKEKNTEKKAERKPVDNWEETRMASGKIYDTPDKSYRIIERKDIDTGESTFDIRNLKNNRAEDIKGIKSLEEAKAFVEKHYGNESNSVKRKQETKDSACRITADTKIRLKK